MTEAMTSSVAGIVVGAFFGILFLMTCVISAVKAVKDRKRIKARNAAKERAAREGVTVVNTVHKEKTTKAKRSANKANGGRAQGQQKTHVYAVSGSVAAARETGETRNGSLAEGGYSSRSKGGNSTSPRRSTPTEDASEVRVTILEDKRLTSTAEMTSVQYRPDSRSHHDQQAVFPPRDELQQQQQRVQRKTRADLHSDPQYFRKSRSADWSHKAQPVEVLFNPRRFSYAAAIDAQYQLELERRGHSADFASTDDILQVYHSSPGQRRAGKENMAFDERDELQL